MPGKRLTLEEIRASIAHRSAAQGGTVSAAEIARDVSCSQSTLYRALRAYNTTFVTERNAARISIATALLKNGLYPQEVADRLGVSVDHLRVVVKRETGWTPGRIARAARLARALGGTPTTHAELTAWLSVDVRLQGMLQDVGPDDCLVDWAKQLIALGHRPELRTDAFLERIRLSDEERRTERDLRRREAHARWNAIDKETARLRDLEWQDENHAWRPTHRGRRELEQWYRDLRRRGRRRKRS